MSIRFRRALIVGSNGQLARALKDAAPAELECIGRTRTELSIQDSAAIAAALDEIQPDIVLNGAAYNLVDKAEGEGDADALNVNALGPARLAAACRERGIPLVHFSTDFVFDGHKRTPYTEEDAARPLGVYGASKLAGENIVLAGSPKNWAIRVCRLYGPIPEELKTQKPAGNFPLLMLKLVRERGSVKVVSDQIGTPTYTPDLARATWQLIEGSEGGLFQLSNEGEVGFDDYAREAVRLAGIEGTVESVTTAEYGAPAARPLYSTMSNAKAYAHGVSPMRHWRDALEEFITGLD
jgi:dTDP-4-dehydrorhamnose reductase